MNHPRAHPALRPLLASLITLALLLSGCAGKNKDAGPASLPAGPTVSSDTGAIDGLILGVDALPMEGAEILIRGPGGEQTTRADAAGKFVASHLAPGEYVVLSSKLGFSTAQKRVAVNAGEVTTVVLTLNEIPLAGVPYKVAANPIKGRFYCGWGAGAYDAASPCMPVSTEETDGLWQQVTGGDKNIFEFRTLIEEKKQSPSDTLATAVVEISWQPTSAGSRWLQAAIEDLPETSNGRNATEPTWAHDKGSGPLKVSATPGKKNAGATHTMPLAAPGFSVGVWPSVDPNSPQVNSNVRAGASAYLDQSFEVWITLFYNEPAPDDYTAILV